jgi:hypothetical protein
MGRVLVVWESGSSEPDCDVQQGVGIREVEGNGMECLEGREVYWNCLRGE